MQNVKSNVGYWHCISHIVVLSRFPQLHNVYVYYCNRNYHFLWECLKTVIETFWESVTTSGSIYNLRERVNRTQLDKNAKVFSVADEFVIHALKAHLLAAVYSMFGISGGHETVEHKLSAEWLQSAVSKAVDHTVILREKMDDVHSFSQAFIMQHLCITIYSTF